MDNLTKIFESIINEAPSIDIAESEFKRMLVDDPELRRIYREYCREQGTSERNGFLEYCDAYCSERDMVWDVLNDYNDEE
ncbi:MAG: hypothetical protein J1F05_01165 [Muribaculaceae bacterium]|nr:hypothetical protein [Muribaculaceae bacterium]